MFRPEVVQEAISKKVGLIFAHHPTPFFGLQKISSKRMIHKSICNANLLKK